MTGISLFVEELVVDFLRLMTMWELAMDEHVLIELTGFIPTKQIGFFVAFNMTCLCCCCRFLLYYQPIQKKTNYDANQLLNCIVLNSKYYLCKMHENLFTNNLYLNAYRLLIHSSSLADSSHSHHYAFYINKISMAKQMEFVLQNINY